MTRICPLCGSGEAALYLRADGREYAHCPVCRLIFVPPGFWPAPEAEKARYLQHQNSGSDADYVAFLRQLSDPLSKLLPQGARGSISARGLRRTDTPFCVNC